MTLDEIFRQLTFGELSQLSMGGAEGSKIRREDYEKVIAHLNMGLKKIYSRFFLSSKDVLIQQYDHIETYMLDRRFAETNTLSPEPYRYIIDSVYEPFQNDVLKIEQVFDEDGRELYLNDRAQPWSLYTPAYNTIQIPYPCQYNSLMVHYRASHPEIEYTPDIDPTQIHVNVPDGLLEALLYYIAGRAFGSLNTDGNAEGNNWMQKYEMACQAAETAGFYVTDNYTNSRLDAEGWV